MLPFAGASALPFAPLLPPRGDPLRERFVQPTLPGHGDRLNEPLLTTIPAMVDDIERSVGVGARDVVYGHSMGALLALGLVRRQRARGHPLPRALIVSGMRAPGTLASRARHALPTPALKVELARLGGTPLAVLDDPDVFAFFEPQVRADFRAVETYAHRAEPALDIPITVIIGTDDEADFASAAAWQHETEHPLTLETMPGGHFFIFRNADAMRERLLSFLAAPSAGPVTRGDTPHTSAVAG
ncbi:MAG: alpha/beta fold hydrolase [Pseudomonadota bacterium]